MIPEYDSDIERTELYRLFAGLFAGEPSAEALIYARDVLQIESDETSDEIGMDFVGILTGTPGNFPPCESFYNLGIQERPVPGGKVSEIVSAFYAAAGLMMDEETDLLPDHISTELLFMSYLTENGLIEYQRRFIDEHLSVWIPGYCDIVVRHAKTVFYKQVANILKEYILSEKDLING